MIGRLTGAVLEESDGTLILDVNGVGYEVIAPLGSIGRTSKNENGTVTLLIHTHVREDALTLFGFANDADRDAFRKLISVSSIGPKSAIGILSAMPAEELGRAIEHKEIGRLTAISGVGKKTAERLLLELKGKITFSAQADSKSPASSKTKSKTAAESPDVLKSALINMGYRAQDAERAVSILGDEVTADAPLAELLRKALAVLAK